MAFLDCPKGHRVIPETRVFLSTGLNFRIDTSPRIRASQESDSHRQEWFSGMERTLARGAQAACCFK